MIFYKTTEGDLPEFQLADDHQFETIQENKQIDLADHWERIKNAQYARADHHDENHRTLLEIVRYMISNDINSLKIDGDRIYQSGLPYDDNIHDAVNWVCIEQGLSDEDFNPEIIQAPWSATVDICLQRT